MNEDTTLPEHNDVVVGHPQKETEGAEDDQANVTPVVDGLPDIENSKEEGNTNEGSTEQPEHNDQGVEQLQEEEPSQMIDGAGEEVRSDGEVKDHDTNKANENSKDVQHASSQVTTQANSPSEEITKSNLATSDSCHQRDEDVGNKTDIKGPSLVQDEEQNNPFKEHLGEGDAHSEIAKTKAPTTAQDTSDSKFVYILGAFTAVLAVLALGFLRSESPPVQKPFNLVDVFHHEMDKVQSSFPSQHKELWRRSRIHLQKHLQMSHPSEPVSLILTSGRGAEKTLGCLAQRLAAAFSTTLNASAVDIDGLSKTTEDSDQVKLDIDKVLREAFDGGKQAAVIHRFEELPPGSTLIFYRYCDHENAAYKKVFLAFTVLLEEELEVTPNVNLGVVEEVVQEYLIEKFVSSERTATFNQMDIDKLSGLWSRISHLILPVSAEETIEHHGCGESG